MYSHGYTEKPCLEPCLPKQNKKLAEIEYILKITLSKMKEQKLYFNKSPIL